MPSTLIPWRPRRRHRFPHWPALALTLMVMMEAALLAPGVPAQAGTPPVARSAQPTCRSLPIGTRKPSAQPTHLPLTCLANLLGSAGNRAPRAQSHGRTSPQTSGNIRTYVGNITGSSGSPQTYTPSDFATAPSAVTMDGLGLVLIADGFHNVVWLANFTGSSVTKYHVTIASNQIAVVAGNGGQGYNSADDTGSTLATQAELDDPTSVAVDSSGNLYIAQYYQSCIREVNASSGDISRFAGNSTCTSGYGGDGQPATSATVQLNGPDGVFVDTNHGNNVYIADTGNNRIREVTGGTITTVAGGGPVCTSPPPSDPLGDGCPPAQAILSNPSSVYVVSTGAMFIADEGDNLIREVYNPGTGTIITKYAGNGTYGFSGDNGSAVSAEIAAPMGLAFDTSGNLYFADRGNNRIRMIPTSGSQQGIITTFAGGSSPGCGSPLNNVGDQCTPIQAVLRSPSSVVTDSAGDVYIADTKDHRVREVTSGTITTAAGNGTASYSGDGNAAAGAEVNAPTSMATDAAGDIFFVDYSNARIRAIPAQGYGPNSFYGLTYAVTAGNIYTVAGTGVAGYSGDGGQASQAQLRAPMGVAVDANSNLYIADTGNNRVRKVTTSGIISTVAGTGVAGYSGDTQPATGAKLFAPTGVAVDNTSGTYSGYLYIADRDNNVIRDVDTSGTINTVAGTGVAGYDGEGSARSYELNSPVAVAVGPSGNVIIADYGNNRVRKLVPNSPVGTLSTVAGGGTGTWNGCQTDSLGDGCPGGQSILLGPSGVAFNYSTHDLYIADRDDNVIRKVNTTGYISAVAGDATNQTPGYSGDGGTATSALLNAPIGVTVVTGSTSYLYIGDTLNNRVRQVVL